MTRRGRGPSWFWVILWLCVFWPVGLYFLFQKMTSDRKAAVHRDSKLPAMGWILLFLGVVLVGSFFDAPSPSLSTLFIGVFFLCGGVASWQTGKKKNREGDKYRRYIDAVANHGLVSVQDIAAYVGEKESQVCKDLKRMIDMGYFDQAYLDESRGIIQLHRRPAPDGAGRPQGYGAGPAGTAGSWGPGPVRPGAAPAYGGASRYPGAGGAQAGPGMPPERMVACRNCGANHIMVAGARNQCEYCGSLLG